MSGGYDRLSNDELERLLSRMDGMQRRLDELERPTGTQISPVPVAASGGFASGASITGDTGVVWVDNTDFASVEVDVPRSASGRALVYVTATIEVNIIQGGPGAGQMETYVSHTTTGGTTGSTTNALVVGSRTGGSNSNNVSVRATAINLVTLTPGATETVKLCAAYMHAGTATGLFAINSMQVAVQVLS